MNNNERSNEIKLSDIEGVALDQTATGIKIAIKNLQELAIETAKKENTREVEEI